MSSGAGYSPTASPPEETGAIFFGDQTFVNQIVNSRFKRHHTVRSSGLHHRGYLVRLPFPDKIGN